MKAFELWAGKVTAFSKLIGLFHGSLRAMLRAMKIMKTWFMKFQREV